MTSNVLYRLEHPYSAISPEMAFCRRTADVESDDMIDDIIARPDIHFETAMPIADLKVGDVAEFLFPSVDRSTSAGNYVTAGRKCIISGGNCVISDGNCVVSDGNSATAGGNCVISNGKCVISGGNWVTLGSDDGVTSGGNDVTASGDCDPSGDSDVEGSEPSSNRPSTDWGFLICHEVLSDNDDDEHIRDSPFVDDVTLTSSGSCSFDARTDPCFLEFNEAEMFLAAFQDSLISSVYENEEIVVGWSGRGSRSSRRYRKRHESLAEKRYKANLRERERIRKLMIGFQVLKEHLPKFKYIQKHIAQLQILREATKYINSLRMMLNDDTPSR